MVLGWDGTGQSAVEETERATHTQGKRDKATEPSSIDNTTTYAVVA